jgi:hypothetical protein
MKNLDHVITKAEEISLSDGDLRTLTDGKCRVMLYSDLMNFDNIDAVLNPHGAVILLYQTNDRLYGHFVCLFRDATQKNRLIFYDSYGRKMDEQLEYSIYNIRNMGGLVPHLSDLIHKSNYSVTSNTKRMQKNNKDDNTCGRYAALRIIFRELSNDQFNYMLASNKHYDADYAVTILTLYHQNFIDILKKN